ncbi:hypothetical protein CsSME_00004003 [Camellia sinensis var. sinensis]
MVMDGYRDEVVVSKPPAATALSNDEERCVDNRSNGFSCSFSAIKERELLCVTSGNTCLGSHLVKKLLSRGYFIRVTIQNQGTPLSPSVCVCRIEAPLPLMA